MKPVLLAVMASVCFAATESPVSFASLRAVEASINDKMRSNVNEPYDLLGTARGTYLDGFGTVFTIELNVVLVSPLTFSPFKPTVSEKEITTLHDRKARKVEDLKQEMRDLMLGASKTLNGLPPNEHIVLEAFLFNFKWENSRNLPKRIVMTAGKQQLLDAANKHLTVAELAKIFDEQEL